MTEEKRICPFITKDDLNPTYCLKEKCMAWGTIALVRGSWEKEFRGCRLIHVSDNHY